MSKTEEREAYVKDKLSPVLEPMVAACMRGQPGDCSDFMLTWLKAKKAGDAEPALERSSADREEYIAKTLTPVLQPMVAAILKDMPDEPLDKMIEHLGSPAAAPAAEPAKDDTAAAEAASAVRQSIAVAKAATTMIFQLGTNNWQVEGGGFAPGSGILHEAHHTAYNKLPNTKSFSVWPLPPKLSHEPAADRTDYRVFKLTHDIPICESVSPVSSLRWHSMSEEDFAAYRKRLADFCYDFMNDAEKETGENFTLFIAHHSFLNPLVGKDVLERRKADGKPDCKLCVFVHGTALKMYVHEKGGKNPEEYPLRFLPIVEEAKLFIKDSDFVSRIFAISAQQVDAFKEIFPDFNEDRVTVSPNGINFDVFKVPEPELTRDQTLKEIKHVPYEGEPADIPDGFDEMVTFVGKFANWKRLDSLLHAAAVYEKAYEEKGKKVCTVIAGSGPPEAIKLYQDLALKELGLKYCYFVGPQQQPMLAKLYAASSVGVFPSKAEPFGLVFVECMACKCPVIGANSGGPKDFVTPDVGFLVPEPGSYEPADCLALSKDLATTITQSIDENWKASKGDACLKLARDRFGVETQVTNLIKSV